MAELGGLRRRRALLEHEWARWVPSLSVRGRAARRRRRAAARARSPSPGPARCAPWTRAGTARRRRRRPGAPRWTFPAAPAGHRPRRRAAQHRRGRRVRHGGHRRVGHHPVDLRRTGDAAPRRAGQLRARRPLGRERDGHQRAVPGPAHRPPAAPSSPPSIWSRPCTAGSATAPRSTRPDGRRSACSTCPRTWDRSHPLAMSDRTDTGLQRSRPGCASAGPPAAGHAAHLPGRRAGVRGRDGRCTLPPRQLEILDAAGPRARTASPRTAARGAVRRPSGHRRRPSRRRSRTCAARWTARCPTRRYALTDPVACDAADVLRRAGAGRHRHGRARATAARCCRRRRRRASRSGATHLEVGGTRGGAGRAPAPSSRCATANARPYDAQVHEHALRLLGPYGDAPPGDRWARPAYVSGPTAAD